MIDPRQKALLRRALAEHRRIAVALAAVLLLNIVAYAFFVYPLSQRVRNSAALTTAAEAELAAARLQHTQASNLVSGRARAVQELETFYKDVLPGDAAAARAIAAPRLSALATQAGVQTRSMRTDAAIDPDALLTRLDIRMDLDGTYQGIRRFVQLLERAREFIVIANLRIVETEEGGELNAQFQLATFYKESAP
jgi:hypothetical protein